jgi:hypothetical protein
VRGIGRASQVDQANMTRPGGPREVVLCGEGFVFGLAVDGSGGLNELKANTGLMPAKAILLSLETAEVWSGRDMESERTVRLEADGERFLEVLQYGSGHPETPAGDQIQGGGVKRIEDRRTPRPAGRKK